MFDFTMSADQLAIRDEVRRLVKSIPRQLILDMDADKIEFPSDFVRQAGRANLLGLRYPKQWGGRGMDWVTTSMVIEEIGTLGYIFACTFGRGDVDDHGERMVQRTCRHARHRCHPRRRSRRCRGRRGG